MKGNKSNTTKVLEKRYENASPQIFSTSLPTGWIPDTTVIEGMFLINIHPWSAHLNIGEYADFLLRQHILPYFRIRSREVYLLFDDPDCQVQSPKYFERKRHDQINPVPDDHYCTEFASAMVIPPKWRENILNCRKCKRRLICFLSQYFLNVIIRKLNPHQRFVTAGGLDDTLRNKALYVEGNNSAKCDDRLTCNAEESDTRIWLHVFHSQGQRKLVLSPDTDVYHIGLPLLAGTSLEVMIKLSSFTSFEQRFLDMQALLTAFSNDPDLAVSQIQSPSVLQMLFVCTGCDFVSFFSGYGKSSFLSTLIEYCEFISGNNTHTPGTLADTDLLLQANGALSFFRLVGCTYFKKYKAAFLPTYPTPFSLFNSLWVKNLTPFTHHCCWLDELRERVWSQVKFEEEMIPSAEALVRHWKRSCWVVSVWKQVATNNISYPPLDTHGRKYDEGNFIVDWDSEENISKVKSRIALIKKRCGCKTGCSSARCKCKKNNSRCGPGCKCLGCHNLPQVSPAPVNVDDDGTESESNSDYDNLEEEVDDIMDQVFGEVNEDDNDLDSEDEASGEYREADRYESMELDI